MTTIASRCSKTQGGPASRDPQPESNPGGKRARQWRGDWNIKPTSEEEAWGQNRPQSQACQGYSLPQLIEALKLYKMAHAQLANRTHPGRPSLPARRPRRYRRQLVAEVLRCVEIHTRRDALDALWGRLMMADRARPAEQITTPVLFPLPVEYAASKGDFALGANSVIRASQAERVLQWFSPI